jgi:hypothetical protein
MADVVMLLQWRINTDQVVVFISDIDGARPDAGTFDHSVYGFNPANIRTIGHAAILLQKKEFVSYVRGTHAVLRAALQFSSTDTLSCRGIALHIPSPSCFYQIPKDVIDSIIVEMNLLDVPILLIGDEDYIRQTITSKKRSFVVLDSESMFFDEEMKKFVKDCFVRV